jgi:hypothetical protein
VTPAALTLNDQSSISGHKERGVLNTGRGTVTLNDSSSISANRSTGVELHGGRLILNDASTIHGNQYSGVIASRGRVSLNDSSSIHDNTGFQGGGVSIGAPGTRIDGHRIGGRLTLRDASSIRDNRTVRHAWQDEAVPPGPGGGIYLVPPSTTVGVACGPGGNVYGNSPDDCYVE